MDNAPKLIAAFSLSSDAVSKSVQTYLKKFPRERNLSIDLLSVRLQQRNYSRVSPLMISSLYLQDSLLTFPSRLLAVQIAIDLCDGLASMMQESFSTMAVDKEATLTELQNALAWWKDTLIDQTADLLQEVVKSNALPGKKRRRASGEADRNAE